KNWATPIGQVGWGRSFGIYGENGELLGEAELFHRHPLESSLHRVELGMGLTQSIHNLGWGTKLLTQAIDWCAGQSFLRWIDLGVFASNSAAIHLYLKLGFVEQGRTPDAFRVFGQQIEDLRMSLDLDSRR
ncbi:MAG TPA: GNAT family N-acetyltransferase, partial [Myxococcales bacterium]|nr:GNAT family N-acetyltransferase [Myxococcales bacterium]